MKVYTKTGDKGTTALVSGERVAKSDDRVEAYGTVDELTAFMALLRDEMSGDTQLAEYVDAIDRINSMLMNVEAHLAAGEGCEYPLPAVSDAAIEELERGIDRMQSALPAITKFTLPGGCKLNSLSHICRTVCRRAERRSIVVAQSYTIEANVVSYLNRLSDYLYLLGRTLTLYCGAKEIFWIPEE